MQDHFSQEITSLALETALMSENSPQTPALSAGARVGVYMWRN
jgi:hypothetical protein